MAETACVSSSSHRAIDITDCREAVEPYWAVGYWLRSVRELLAAHWRHPSAQKGRFCSFSGEDFEYAAGDGDKPPLQK